MELKSAKCPNCGGKLQLNPNIEKGICIYCGSEIIVEDAIRLGREVDGIATVRTHLIRADQLLEDGEMDKAAKEFKDVINLKPDCAEAHFGLFRCEVASANYYLRLNYSLARAVSDYINDINLAKEKHGKRALQYATDDQKKEYEEYINAAVSEAYSKADETNWNKKSLIGKGFAKLFGGK